jgi:SOS-response transcriptional repressor LexA
MLGERIKYAMSRAGMKQVELARKVGVKQQTISYLCKTNSAQSQYVVRIAEALGVNPRWLQDGVGDPHDTTVRIEVSGVEIRLTNLPLLRDKEVLRWLEAGEVSSPRADFVTDRDVGKRAFGIEIRDDSMSPVLSVGDRIAIDPDCKPRPGDVVCASAAGSILVRRYREQQGGRFELVPANADWPSAASQDADVSVIGVMVEHRRYRTHTS